MNHELVDPVGRVVVPRGGLDTGAAVGEYRDNDMGTPQSSLTICTVRSLS
jgi:hypothetical protein